jgi:hypothetical protein
LQGFNGLLSFELRYKSRKDSNEDGYNDSDPLYGISPDEG